MTPTTRPTCFVISPIGGEGTDTRKAADDFLELLIEPTLQQFNFDVVRADRIARPSMITNDIVQLVQQSELCIIDLTGGNPNVFYECGRRHETGKPFLQFVAKGQEGALPFDVAGIRTIAYDLSSARAVLISQKILQEFIQQLISSGFSNATRGESLGSIAQTLERIERKVSNLFDLPSPKSMLPLIADDKQTLMERILRPPQQVFFDALQSGDIDLAHKQLVRLKQASGTGEYLGALGLLVSIGDAQAFALMENEMDKMLQGALPVEHDMARICFEMLKNYFANSGKSTEGVNYLSALFQRVQPSGMFTEETKAFLANKIGMVAWNADQYGDCARYTKLATEYAPDDPSYWYNLCLVYKHEGMSAELNKALDTLAGLKDLDSDHLRMLREHGVSKKV